MPRAPACSFLLPQVDIGTVPLPGSPSELYTQGLDNLRQRADKCARRAAGRRRRRPAGRAPRAATRGDCCGGGGSGLGGSLVEARQPRPPARINPARSPTQNPLKPP
jgi:hypothetical protein